MAHYAKVINGIVENVIVADGEFVNSGAIGDPSEWIKCSYNTRGGTYYDREGNVSDAKAPLRGNYPGKGYTYDSELDVFYSPQPFPSFTLNKETYLWESPIPYPTRQEGDPYVKYTWDETTLSWIVVG